MVGLMFRKSLVFFLIAIFCALQVSPCLTVSPDWCVSGSTALIASVPSANSHHCCCPEKGPRCCDMEQESTPHLPDMAINATSGGSCDYAPRFETLGTGIQNLIPVQNQQLLQVLNDTGPPLTSFYLTNLTLRC
jgi:hypothetical protein